MDDEAYCSGGLPSGMASPASLSDKGSDTTARKLPPSDPASGKKSTQDCKLPGIGGAKGNAPEAQTLPQRSSQTVPTPTTHLAYQMNRILARRMVDSPTGESGYGSLSLPSMPSMGEDGNQPTSLSRKRPSPSDRLVEEEEEGEGGGGSVQQEDADHSSEERLESGFVEESMEEEEEEAAARHPPAPQRVTLPLPPPRSSTSPVVELEKKEEEEEGESPASVPPVGESVEIMTDIAMEQHLARPLSGRDLKRTARGKESSAAKSPRLTDPRLVSMAVAALSSSQKPIRVSTIKSGKGFIKRKGDGDKSPERLEAKSPVFMGDGGGADVEGMECEVRTEQSAASLPPPRKGRVNYDSIKELSTSARLPASLTGRVDTSDIAARGASFPSLLPGTDLGPFSLRRSPNPLESPQLSSSSPRLSPHSSKQSRSTSPHSPHSPHHGTKGDDKQEKLDSEHEPSEGYHSMEASGKKESEAKGKDSKESKPEAQNALLQVSEAHLAILPDEDGDTPLHLSIIHENVPLTQYLVRLIVGVHMNLDIANNMRQTPLHLSVITRQPSMVQLLVNARASVNFPDRKGNSSIHLAAQRRDLRVLQILAQATSPLPDYNIKNFAGLTAVHVATKEASLDVLKFLFLMGANKNTHDACSGRSPLHYAVESENFTLVNYLLENGCNVNAATFSGNTPLHIAAGRRLKEIVALLMAYGANPAIANGEGDFPSDLPASLLMQRARMNAH